LRPVHAPFPQADRAPIVRPARASARLIAALLLALGASSSARAQSAWLPLAGELVATPAVSFSSFDRFWAGSSRDDRLDDANESLDQFNGFVTLDYGILDCLAFDATVGYTSVGDTRSFGNSDKDGLADTLLGLRMRVLDEGEYWPTVAVRIGGVIAGTYDENTPFAPGDGADAFDPSLMFAKSFGESGFGTYGDFGYRVRNNSVPDEYHGSVGVFKQFVGLLFAEDAVTISAGYRHVESHTGLDIGGPGFDPNGGDSSGFPALEEVNQLFEGAVGYTDVGGRHYQASIAKSIEGRNTGDKFIFGFSVSLPLHLPPIFGD
jgi:hypothetical protein